MVRRRGMDGTTKDYLNSLSFEGEPSLGGLSPTFGLHVFTLEHDDLESCEHPYRVACGYSEETQHGIGEASTQGKAGFLAFAEAIEILNLRAETLADRESEETKNDRAGG